MKEEILQIASDLREGHITSNEAKAQLLRLFNVSGQLPPSNCSKCGRSGYSSGKPFCTDDFCNGGNLR
jgi:ArsR family metal-binding transcriptional regulator